MSAVNVVTYEVISRADQTFDTALVETTTTTAASGWAIEEEDAIERMAAFFDRLIERLPPERRAEAIANALGAADPQEPRER